MDDAGAAAGASSTPSSTADPPHQAEGLPAAAGPVAPDGELPDPPGRQVAHEPLEGGGVGVRQRVGRAGGRRAAPAEQRRRGRREALGAVGTRVAVGGRSAVEPRRHHERDPVHRPVRDQDDVVPLPELDDGPQAVDTGPSLGGHHPVAADRADAHRARAVRRVRPAGTVGVDAHQVGARQARGDGHREVDAVVPQSLHLRHAGAAGPAEHLLPAVQRLLLHEQGVGRPGSVVGPQRRPGREAHERGGDQRGGARDGGRPQAGPGGPVPPAGVAEGLTHRMSSSAVTKTIEWGLAGPQSPWGHDSRSKSMQSSVKPGVRNDVSSVSVSSSLTSARQTRWSPFRPVRATK